MAVHVGWRGPAHRTRTAAAPPGGGGGPDVTPDPFDLGGVSSAVLSAIYESAVVVVSGIDAPANLSISGGECAINGGAWSSSGATVNAGDTVKVRRAASGSPGASVAATLSIGGMADDFTLTTVDHAETSSLVQRFAADPGAARRGLIDACIGSLKASGVWSKLDALYLLAAHDAQAAQRNWIQNAYNLSPSGAPVFTPDRGYAGDGTSAYLDTGFNDLTGSALWTQDTLALGAYVNQYAGGANPFVGLATATTLRIGSTTSAITTRVHNSTSFNPAFTSPLPGHVAITRDAATSSRCLRNGASVATTTAASAPSANANIVLFRSSTSYNADRVACLHIGGFLTPAEVSDLYAAILAYLTALGAT